MDKKTIAKLLKAPLMIMLVIAWAISFFTLGSEGSDLASFIVYTVVLLLYFIGALISRENKETEESETYWELKMLKYKIAFFLLFIFSLFGFFFILVYVHELSHKYDFRKISEGGYICLLALPEDSSNILSLFKIGGYYSFSHDVSENDEVYTLIKRYTELKAYTTSVIILIVYIVVIIINVQAEYGRNRILQFRNGENKIQSA